ncbi:bifunctional hydroxymethylpyrimidine kinase/phosphomethylpyrimidine kinase [Paenactinomyces guangxiensis]|uniref:Hydroxymethylpyrimidine/phosphomethylpyrimidine kinase n=1 Tax=Paenactinomyces guangxiensis TaxID=1490290 RepID=A0A7W1WR59_9BACL|nr:bifunctional hydroxymethylpyrimidine kinase/phosphomethylpyrimidine kinase [Paenactinomyces guangxiensis]MBA4494535.1 bifunctional hydroxymethylpyrimidine kinase/phosphomethylpyrimidine kinase [Paenactinomyces guangxiensis]MBH8591703.1 bifunctional hydroxymethylpyrimidine kinase/phosphomethylpyrimidine kinase [Paenactinomyces guangxiensis]
MSSVARALTIAGSDSGGGAGIQADLKTFQELRVFGMSALTAVTAQNTLGVTGIYELESEAVATQIDAVATDIGVDAVKTGMIANIQIMKTIAAKIEEHSIPNLVIDPVMIAKSGDSLLNSDARLALKKYLIPLATVVTPNLPEAEVLTGLTLDSLDSRKQAARLIVSMGARSVVIKGGHLAGEAAEDLFYDGNEFSILSAPRIETPHTHGTGCTFSAAITAHLAKGTSLPAAVQQAKTFITAAISHPLHLGKGHGPTNHWAHRLQEGKS